MEPSTGVAVPLWQRDAPDDTGGWATLGTPLRGESRCDVAVVGAGITGLTTAVLLARGGLAVVVLEARHIGAGTTGSSSAKVSLVQSTRFSGLTRRHGVVGRDGIRPVAVSRIDGRVHAVSAICPHLGGILRWNAAERSWDCPLHGSRFAPDGSRLEGPARCDLAQVVPPSTTL